MSGDLDLLKFRVGWDFDELKTVTERSWDVLKVVRGSDEENIRQIVRFFDEVIIKGEVLLWVKNL